MAKIDIQIALRPISNLEYANSLPWSKLPYVTRIINRHIEKTVGIDAPIWEKERVYDEWCESKYSAERWAILGA